MSPSLKKLPPLRGPEAKAETGMVILGIDPGLTVTGYGALRLEKQKVKLVEAGVIRTREDQSTALRLAELSSCVTEILRMLAPEAVVVESLYSHYKHPRTAILMGHARGVVLAAAAEQLLPVFDYPATLIKKSLTGNGHASKSQIQRTIALLLSLEHLPEPADVADALAAALCHFNVLRHQATLTAAGRRR